MLSDRHADLRHEVRRKPPAAGDELWDLLLKMAKGKRGGDGELPKHTRKKRPSTQEKHEKGMSRKGRDRKGGEKGDWRRPY